MMLKKLLRRDDKGIGAVEFGLIAPVLISFIIGVSQVGRMFYANADMKNAVAHGARVASVFPTPENDVIKAAVDDRLMRTGANARATTTVVRGTENGNDYVEIGITYSVPLEFIFFETPPVTLRDTRRVFRQVGNALQNNAPAGGTTTSTTSTTSSTSAGGTTSATSAGGTTSSTSATSAGGTSASSTSASSTSASTSASSTTSASSSGSNGSNGSNGNNGSSGNHDHGNCKKCA